MFLDSIGYLILLFILLFFIRLNILMDQEGLKLIQDGLRQAATLYFMGMVEMIKFKMLYMFFVLQF